VPTKTADRRSVKQVNRIPRPIGIFLIILAAVVILVAGAAAVENASLGESSWIHPGVSHTVNGYSGARVGSPIYRPATEG